MSRIDALMKRFRGIAQPRIHERVLTRTSKLEVMTSTQAVRFRELKQPSRGTGPKAESEQAKPYYRLPEACRRSNLPVKRLLQAAAAGKLTCYVFAAGLRGSWHGKGPSEVDGRPQYLALTPDDCRDMEAWGSVNVHELLDPGEAGPPGATVTFRLLEPLWVDPESVLLKHPLPDGQEL